MVPAMEERNLTPSSWALLSFAAVMAGVTESDQIVAPER